MLDIIRSTLKNTFIYSIGTFSSRLVGFILIPLYTSNFSVEEYGMLGIMEISSQVLIALMGFSLHNAYFRWYWDNQYPGKQKSLLFSILVFFAVQLLLFFIIMLPLKNELSRILFDSDQYGYLVRLLLYTSSFEAFGVIISTLLRLKERAAYYTYTQVIKLAVGLAVTIYLIRFRDRGIEAVYEALLVSNAVYFLLILKLLVQSIEYTFEWKIMKEMLAFSLPLVLTSVSSIILNITDRYTLRFLSDMSTVGIYSLGFKVANTLRVVIIASISLALQPMIFKMMDAPDNKRFYSKTMTYYMFGLMFFVLFFALFSSEIIKVISRDTQYWDACKIIPVLSFSMIFGMLRDVAFTGLNKMKKTKVIAWIIIVASLLNVGLNILFIPTWGFYGAACATAISQCVFFIMVYLIAQRYFFIPYEWKKLCLMFITGIGIYLLSLLATTFPLILRIPVKMLLIGFFPVILYFFRFYESIELERIGQFWNKWRNPAHWGSNIKNIKWN